MQNAKYKIMFVHPHGIVRIVIVAMPAPSPSASLPPLPWGEARFVHLRSIVRYCDCCAMLSRHDTQVVPYKYNSNLQVRNLKSNVNLRSYQLPIPVNRRAQDGTSSSSRPTMYVPNLQAHNLKSNVNSPSHRSAIQ